MKQKKHFRSGGVLFLLLMLLWRGPLYLGRRLWTLVYRRAIHQCGHATTFATGVYVDRPDSITIGNAAFIGKDVMIGAEIREGRLVVANNVQISEGCRIDYSGGLQIESNVLLSPNVTILTHDHGYDPRSQPRGFSLVIEANAWVGMNALILPGTGSIGRDAIVGAGSVVTRAVPDKAIVAGNPARVIKYRGDN
jgi:acetyltransferase-like isoleucine patch superfamily enzyme